MTNDEIKDYLDALGVEYPKDAKHAELEALYEANKPVEPTEADPATTSEPEVAQKAKHATVTADTGLNLRETPNGVVVDVLMHGTECEVLEHDGEWCRVSRQQIGWVKAEFLDISA